MDAKSVWNVQSIIAVTNKHIAKLHHVGSLYVLNKSDLFLVLYEWNIELVLNLLKYICV